MPSFNERWEKLRCRMNRHKEPRYPRFDGVSMTGRCPHCGEFCLRSREGVWFSIEHLTMSNK
jgi:hypothetical protein